MITTKEIRLLGIFVTDRIKEAGKVQDILSKFSKYIKIRLGFHDLTDEVCSRNACIILQLMGKHSKWDELETNLNNIDGLIVKKMIFNY